MASPRSWLTAHAKVYPPAEVTNTNVAAEVDPREADLSPADVAEIWGSIVRLYETGLHPALSVCLRRRGKIILERSLGHIRGNSPDDTPDTPKVAARYDSLFNLYSASKAVTAMVIHLLNQRDLVHLDDAVAEYIPEFAKHGKEAVTIRQVLTHRSGIPTLAGTKVDLDLLADWDRVVDLLCDAKLMSVPGRRLAYHALTGGYVLGEIVRRVTGSDVKAYLEDQVLRPIGFRSFTYGVAPERIPEVAENAFTGISKVAPQSWFVRRLLGVGPREATAFSNDRRYLTAIVPSGNIVGTAEEASRFFQLLLNDGEYNGVRVFEKRTIRRAIAEQSYLEIDSFLGMPVRYGMGFMLGGKNFSIYGGDTPAAFGHIGFTNVIAWADPERDISVGLMTSGKPLFTPGQIAWLSVARTIARRCSKVSR